MDARSLYHRVFGPLPDDPARRWAGSASGEDGALRVAFYGDCSMRAMDGSHGTHNPIGWPRVVAERIPLEFSSVFVTMFDWLPRREDLTLHLRLSGDPDVVFVQLGALYPRRTVVPDTPRFLRLREDIGRRLGGGVFAGYRVVRPLVRAFGRQRVAYPGIDGLDRFLADVREEWPDATLAVLLPFPRLYATGQQRTIEARVRADLIAASDRAGVPCLDLAGPAGDEQRLRCANGYNLSAAGAERVGAEIARSLGDGRLRVRRLVGARGA